MASCREIGCRRRPAPLALRPPASHPTQAPPPTPTPPRRAQATTPSGVKVKLVVPEGAVPGTNLTFALPPQAQAASETRLAALVKIQSRRRGQIARRDGRSPVVLRATKQEQEAITRVQSVFRGHSARNDQQEAARLEWMAYYMQPDVQRWEEALKLAVTPEEEAMVENAQKGVSEEEVKRLKWLEHYTTSGVYDKADALVVTPLEAATVLKARSISAKGFCSCVGDKAQTESRRAVQFVSSVRSYQWDVAEVLAISADELQDVADSKLRVETMAELQRSGDINGALAYAITEAERAKIRAASNAPH